jgi:hypothetical protein
VQAEPEVTPQVVQVGLARRPEVRSDGRQALLRRQRVAVAHGPERRARGAEAPREGVAEIGQAVELPPGRLADAAVHGREVVAVDRGGPRRHGAGRSLRVVVGIAGDAVLRHHVGPDHLEHVELRGDLEQRTAILRHPVQGAHVALDDGQTLPARAPRGRRGRRGRAQFGQ